MGSEEAVDGTYSVTIVGTELRESAKGKSFTVFQIFVAQFDEAWVVLRRYSQFYTLNEKLKAKFGTLMKTAAKRFPGKRFRRNLSPASVDKRHMKLQQYLNICLKIPQVHDSFEMRMFLITGQQPVDDFLNVLEGFAEAVELLNPHSSSFQSESAALDVLRKGSQGVAEGALLKADLRYMGKLYKYHAGHWKSRYFQLRGSTLYKYNSRKDTHPTGRYPLQGAQILVLGSEERNQLKGNQSFCFRIVTATAGPPYGRVFAAKSEEFLKAWLCALMDAKAAEEHPDALQNSKIRERGITMIGRSLDLSDVFHEDSAKGGDVDPTSPRRSFRVSLMSSKPDSRHPPAESKEKEKERERGVSFSTSAPVVKGPAPNIPALRSHAQTSFDRRSHSSNPLLPPRGDGGAAVMDFVDSLLSSVEDRAVDMRTLVLAASQFLEKNSNNQTEPLILFDFALSFIALHGIREKEHQIAMLRSLIACLPQKNQEMLSRLVCFLFWQTKVFENGLLASPRETEEGEKNPTVIKQGSPDEKVEGGEGGEEENGSKKEKEKDKGGKKKKKKGRGGKEKQNGSARSPRSPRGKRKKGKGKEKEHHSKKGHEDHEKMEGEDEVAHEDEESPSMRGGGDSQLPAVDQLAAVFGKNIISAYRVHPYFEEQQVDVETDAIQAVTKLLIGCYEDIFIASESRPLPKPKQMTTFTKRQRVRFLKKLRETEREQREKRQQDHPDNDAPSSTEVSPREDHGVSASDPDGFGSELEPIKTKEDEDLEARIQDMEKIRKFKGHELEAKKKQLQDRKKELERAKRVEREAKDGTKAGSAHGSGIGGNKTSTGIEDAVILEGLDIEAMLQETAEARKAKAKEAEMKKNSQKDTTPKSTATTPTTITTAEKPVAKSNHNKRRPGKHSRNVDNNNNRAHNRHRRPKDKTNTSSPSPSPSPRGQAKAPTPSPSPSSSKKPIILPGPDLPPTDAESKKLSKLADKALDLLDKLESDNEKMSLRDTSNSSLEEEDGSPRVITDERDLYLPRSSEKVEKGKGSKKKKRQGETDAAKKDKPKPTRTEVSAQPIKRSNNNNNKMGTQIANRAHQKQVTRKTVSERRVPRINWEQPPSGPAPRQEFHSDNEESDVEAGEEDDTESSEEEAAVEKKLKKTMASSLNGDLKRQIVSALAKNKHNL